MAVRTIHCPDCDYTTDIETTSETNPQHCPRCGGGLCDAYTGSPFWRIGDTYYQADLYRHGRGLDYDCPPRRTLEEAEADLQYALGDMTEREREQAQIESTVRRYVVDSLDAYGTIGAAHTTD